MAPGTRIVLLRDVERYPHAYVPAGSTGTVTDGYDPSIVFAVTLDDKYDGLDEWDNALLWFDDYLDDIDLDLKEIP